MQPRKRNTATGPTLSEKVIFKLWHHRATYFPVFVFYLFGDPTEQLTVWCFFLEIFPHLAHYLLSASTSRLGPSLSRLAELSWMWIRLLVPETHVKEQLSFSSVFLFFSRFCHAQPFSLLISPGYQILLSILLGFYVLCCLLCSRLFLQSLNLSLE